MGKVKLQEMILMKRHLNGLHDENGTHYIHNDDVGEIECPLCRDEVEK